MCFSIMVYCRILNKFPVLYNRTLLFFHAIYNGLHLLIPNSRSEPPLAHFPAGNHKSFLCVCDTDRETVYAL